MLNRRSEIEPLAANTSVADGVSNTLPASGYFACRYMWGVGVGRFTLDVTINEASRNISRHESGRDQAATPGVSQSQDG
jgi:hypothetical protein